MPAIDYMTAMPRTLTTLVAGLLLSATFAQAQPVYPAADPRPDQWCAWWLRRYLHIPREAFPPYAYNLARAFARLGHPAPRGCVDCVAVFARGRGGHVGLVKQWDARGNPVILSGNVNGRVVTAPHAANRLIALRWVDPAIYR